MQKNLQNVEDGHLLSKLITTAKKTAGDNMIKVDSDHPQPLLKNDIKVFLSLTVLQFAINFQSLNYLNIERINYYKII